METRDKLNNVLGYLSAMAFDKPELSNELENPLNDLSEAIIEVENLSLSGVIHWVACKEEIPLRRRVLMYMVKKNVKAVIIGGYTEENGWMSKGEKFTNNEITHWAELPKPPCL